MQSTKAALPITIPHQPNFIITEGPRKKWTQLALLIDQGSSQEIILKMLESADVNIKPNPRYDSYLEYVMSSPDKIWLVPFLVLKGAKINADSIKIAQSNPEYRLVLNIFAWAKIKEYLEKKARLDRWVLDIIKAEKLDLDKVTTPAAFGFNKAISLDRLFKEEDEFLLSKCMEFFARANGAEVKTISLEKREANNNPQEDFFSAVKEAKYIKIDALRKQYEPEKKINLYAQDAQKNTGLHFAAIHCCGEKGLAFLRMFKDAGCSLNGKNVVGKTPLFLAVENENNDAVGWLVENGADLSQRYQIDTDSKEEVTVLQYALKKKKNAELISKLLRKSNINMPASGNDLPPLHLASKYGHLKAVKYMVEICRANTNLKDEKEFSPLYHAAKGQNFEVVNELLRLNAEYDDNDPRFSALFSPVQSSDNKENPMQRIQERLKDHAQTLKSKHENQGNRIEGMLNGLSFEWLKLKAKQEDRYEKALKSALVNFPALSKVLESIPEDMHAQQIREHKTTQRFSDYIKFNLASTFGSKADPDSKEWGRGVKTIVETYIKLTPEQIDLENCTNKIVYDLNKEQMKNLTTLKRWIAEKLKSNECLSSERSKEIIVSLQKSIKEEIEYSLSEVNVPRNEEKCLIAEKIYSRRIQAAIDKWLYEHNYFSAEDKLVYEVANQLTKKLETHCVEINRDKQGMKAKKAGIARCIFIEVLKGDVLSSVLKDSKFLKIFVQNSDIVKGLRSKLIENLFNKFKVQKMKSFSIDLKRQERYRREVLVELESVFVGIDEQQVAVADEKREATDELRLSDSDNRSRFVASLCEELHGDIGKQKNIAAGEVERKKTSGDNIANVVSENKNIFSGAGGFFELIARVFVYCEDSSVKEKAERVKNIFQAYNPTMLAEEVKGNAEFIADCHVDQINNLEPRSAEILGKIAGTIITEYIKNGDLYKDIPSIIDKLKDFFNEIIDRENCSPKTVRTMKLMKEIFAHALWLGKFKEETQLITKKGNIWMPEGIFRSTGLIVKDEKDEIIIYTHEKLTKVMDEAKKDYSNPLKYGYSYGVNEKVAKKRGYEVDLKMPLEMRHAIIKHRFFKDYEPVGNKREKPCDLAANPSPKPGSPKS